MTFLYVGDHRLRMRRAMRFNAGIKPNRGSRPGHRTIYRWEVTFDRGPAVGCGASPSFFVAVACAIWATYANARFQRQLRRAGL